MKKALRDCGGYIVVETITAFVLFTLLLISILSLINIVTVQARVHYAITQAAQTCSMYSYVLNVTGAAGHMKKSAEMREHLEADANTMKTRVNDIVDGVRALAGGDIKEGNFSKVKNAGKEAWNQGKGWVDDIMDDPKKSLQIVMNYGLGQTQSELFEMLLRPLVGHYLYNGDMDGDRFLTTFNVSSGEGKNSVYGVNGLVFSDFDLFDLQSTDANDSTLMTSKGEVKIIVRYDVDYFFGILQPAGGPKLHIVQEVVTKAWLGGKGEGYKE